MFLVRRISFSLLIQIIFISSYSNAFVDRSVGTVIIKDLVDQDIEVSEISLEYMTELYDEVKSNKGIPFRYPDDGCYARAHKMAMILEQEGIITVKTFVIGDLRLNTKDSPWGYVDWWYHVVPSVRIKNSKSLMVFDPTASETPMTKEDWMKNLTQHRYGSIDDEFETIRFVYGPDNARDNPRPIAYAQEDILDMQDALEYFMDMQEQRGIEATTNYLSSTNQNRQTTPTYISRRAPSAKAVKLNLNKIGPR